MGQSEGIDQVVQDGALDIVEEAIATGNSTIVLIIVVAFIVIPLSFAFVLNLKKQKESTSILDNQKFFLEEQRDVNSIILKQIKHDVDKEFFTTFQLVSIFNDLLILIKHDIIAETKKTIFMNNLAAKDNTIERIKTYSRNITAKQLEKLGWYTYKGSKVIDIISNEWFNIPESTIVNYVYSNPHATEHIDGDKSQYYEFNVLDRDLDLALDVISSNFSKRINHYKSEIENKLEDYE